MTNQDYRYRLAHGVKDNGLALPDREGLRRSPVPCLVAVRWQFVKPCPILALPSGLIEVPACPWSRSPSNKTAQRQGSFR